MKLIFWLLLGSFHLIYGNDEPRSRIIDTLELDESDQQFVKTLKDTETRNQAKKSLWKKQEKIREHEKEIHAYKKEICEKDEKIREKDVKIREKDEKLNNSVYNFVNCAMSQVKSLLEIVHRNKVKKAVVPPSNEVAFKLCANIHSFGMGNEDQHTLILREMNWTERFHNTSKGNKSHFEVYTQDIMRYIRDWLRYLHTEEAEKLRKLLVNESTTIENGCRPFVRFSSNMARLFKIACVTCNNLLPILRTRSLEEKNKTFINHLRDLVPEWSLTGQQIYFFNKLMEFVYPHYEESDGLLAYEFGTIDITNSRSVTFYLPYTTENCGLQGNETTRNFLTYDDN